MSPERAFVLAALRADARASDARASAAARVTDWDRAAEIAAQHDVAWWVHRALPAVAGTASARQFLNERVRAIASAALAGTSELLAIARALEEGGVSMAAYKGPALAVDVHGDLGARWFTDLDVLVARCDRERALAALGDLGYTSPAGYTAREASFYSAWEGVSHLTREGAARPVEVHWRVQAPRYGPPQDPAEVVAGARPCRVGGGAVRVPDVETQAVLLALHGVKHAWTSLLWVVDFGNAVARDGFGWPRFMAIAARWRVLRAVHDALLVARALVALDVPTWVLARAHADASAVRLATAAVHGLCSDDAEPNRGCEATPQYDLQWLDGGWARVRYLALASMLPTPQERRLVRLPDALLPLAVPVRAWRLLRQAAGGTP
jgi:hypothetical protein